MITAGYVFEMKKKLNWFEGIKRLLISISGVWVGLNFALFIYAEIKLGAAWRIIENNEMIVGDQGAQAIVRSAEDEVIYWSPKADFFFQTTIFSIVVITVLAIVAVWVFRGLTDEGRKDGSN
jgi:hypothetical protein